MSPSGADRVFFLPVLSLICVYTAYGAAPVVVRLYALHDSNPVFFSFARITISIPVLFVASCVAERGRVARPQRMDEVLRLAVVGERGFSSAGEV